MKKSIKPMKEQEIQSRVNEVMLYFDQPRKERCFYLMITFPVLDGRPDAVRFVNKLRQLGYTCVIGDWYITISKD